MTVILNISVFFYVRCTCPSKIIAKKQSKMAIKRLIPWKYKICHHLKDQKSSKKWTVEMVDEQGAELWIKGALLQLLPLVLGEKIVLSTKIDFQKLDWCSIALEFKYVQIWKENTLALELPPFRIFFLIHICSLPIYLLFRLWIYGFGMEIPSNCTLYTVVLNLTRFKK